MDKLTDEQIDAMTGEVLDRAVAEHVMGWTVSYKRFFTSPETFITDWKPSMRFDDCFEATEIIEMRHLCAQYGDALFRQLYCGQWPPSQVSMVYYELATASPLDRCRAMLKTVMHNETPLLEVWSNT